MTDFRKEQLGILIDMLYKMRDIDKGSGFMGTLQQCIEDATKLTEADFGREDIDSFVTFLQDELLG